MLTKPYTLLLHKPKHQFCQQTKKVFMIQYRWIQDMYYHRLAVREEHLDLVKKLEIKGYQVFGGPTFPLQKSYMLIQGPNIDEIYWFLKNDPYLKCQLAIDWQIHQLNQNTVQDIERITNIYDYK